MSDLDYFNLRHTTSMQLASTLETMIKNNRKSPGSDETSSEDGRKREYYDYLKAIPWKEGYRYAARFWLVVSILFIVILTVGWIQKIKAPESVAIINTDNPMFYCMGYFFLALLAAKSLYELRRLRHLEDYGKVMEDSREAEIPLEILAEKAGVSTQRAMKDLRWLFKKNLMEYCSLILDEKPRVVLTDILLDIFLIENTFCTDCSYVPTQIGPEGTVICPECGRIYASMRKKNNENPVSAFAGVKAYVWNNWYLWEFLNIRRTELIKNITSAMFAAGIILTALLTTSIFLVATLVYNDVTIDYSLISHDTITLIIVRFLIAYAVFISPLLLCWLLRQAVELAVRCNPYLIQTNSSRISCETIASMMGWTVSKTKKIMRLCFVLKLMDYCSWQDGSIVKITGSGQESF